MGPAVWGTPEPRPCQVCNLWSTTAEEYEMTDDDVEYILRCLAEDGLLNEDEV